MKDVVEFARDMTTQRLFSFYLTLFKDTYMYTSNQLTGLNDTNHVNGFNLLRNNNYFKFRIKPNMNSCILMFDYIDVHLPLASTPGPIFKYMSQTLY